MTKKEVNQQSSNIKFKLKLKKVERKDPHDPLKKKLNQGLYKQLKNSGNIVQYNKLSLKEIEEAVTEIFYGKSKNK